MPRLYWPWLVCIASVLCSGQPVPLRTQTDRVIIPIEARDRSHRNVRGLTKSDFLIFDEGRAVKDFTLSVDEEPASIVLLLDTSGSMKKMSRDLLEALRAFFVNLQASDELLLLTFAKTVTRQTDWTENRDLILRAVESTIPDGCTALYDGVTEAFRTAQTGRYGKRAVIVITDSGDTCSLRTSAEFAREARETTTFLYVLARHARTEDDEDYHNINLQEGCHWTGGRFFLYLTSREFRPLMAQIDFRERYVVSFRPNTAVARTEHRVVVKFVGTREVRLNWRRVYRMSPSPM